MSQPTDHLDRATLDAPAHWTLKTINVPCYLKDGETQRDVKVTVDISDSGIIELKSVNTFELPRTEFDSLSTDIGEFFLKGHGNSPYKEYRGLFNNELQ